MEIKKYYRVCHKDTLQGLWYDYKGQIGYTLVGKPANEMEALSRNIREHEGLYQNTYTDPNAFHAVTYDNVKITLIK